MFTSSVAKHLMCGRVVKDHLLCESLYAECASEIMSKWSVSDKDYEVMHTDGFLFWVTRYVVYSRS